MSFTASSSYSYTVADIETVMRRFSADIVMIAASTGAMSESMARNIAHDAEELAKKEYLRKIDVTLLSFGVEHRATTYNINASSGDLASSRPGGVMWPKLVSAELRVIFRYSDSYSISAKEEMRKRLKLEWVPSSDDISHSGLRTVGGRDFVSNGWGLQRKDFAA